MPALYRRRPSTVEAMPYAINLDRLIDVAAWVSKAGGAVVRRIDGTITIRAKGLETHVKDGMMVVRDQSGRFFAYDKPTFQAMYIDIL